MRYIALAGLLFGCASAPEDSAQWNTCLQTVAHIGYRIKNDKGQIGTVTAIYGRSSKCAVETHPLLGSVAYE